MMMEKNFDAIFFGDSLWIQTSNVNLNLIEWTQVFQLFCFGPISFSAGCIITAISDLIIVIRISHFLDMLERAKYEICHKDLLHARNNLIVKLIGKLRLRSVLYAFNAIHGCLTLRRNP
jgi:hypothetical protein